jgi:hypothetical protein
MLKNLLKRFISHIDNDNKLNTGFNNSAYSYEYKEYEELLKRLTRFIYSSHIANQMVAEALI